MDDSVTPKKIKLLHHPLVVEWSKRSPSAPYHFRLHLNLKVLPKYIHGHHYCPQEPPRNIRFVFIRSDWNNQLYRRVWGTLLPSVDEDTNQSKSWYLPVQVWLCDNEGVGRRWLLTVLLSLEVTFRRPARLWSSSQSCITCQCKHADQLLLFPDHLTQN